MTRDQRQQQQQQDRTALPNEITFTAFLFLPFDPFATVRPSGPEPRKSINIIAPAVDHDNVLLLPPLASSDNGDTFSSHAI